MEKTKAKVRVSVTTRIVGILGLLVSIGLHSTDCLAQKKANSYMPGGEQRQKSIDFEDGTVEALNRDRADLNTMSKSWKDRRKNHLYQTQKENLYRDESKNTMRELRYSQ